MTKKVREKSMTKKCEKSVTKKVRQKSVRKVWDYHMHA